ncbi:molybdopterin-dependent oxidoreductase [Streptomyces sp. NPDC001606]
MTPSAPTPNGPDTPSSPNRATPGRPGAPIDALPPAADGSVSLADELRERHGRTSVRLGCEEGVCGSCTVLVDRRTARSCTVPAGQVAGSAIRTAEDAAADPLLRHLQEVFWAEHAFQCGFCAAGFLMETHALLTENPRPTEAEVRTRLAGNLCRCTGYDSIVRAVLTAAATLPAGTPPRAEPGDDGIGSSALRPQDRDFLTGDARYVADLTVPGMLHARFVRSPHAHARITGIDVAPALAVPGVVAVYTAADLAGSLNPITVGCPLPGYTSPAFAPLQGDRVRFEGDPVALVVAGSARVAEDAADLVAVGYQVLKPVMDPRAATAEPLFDEVDGNVLYTEHRRHGDCESAFAEATRVVRHRLRQERVQNAPLEPRGGLAVYDPETGRLGYDVASQSPNSHRAFLAEVLGLDPELIRVRVPANMGGSFGIKGGMYREDAAVCWASIRLGRPVRWIEDRREHLTAAGQARGEEIDIEVALGPDGAILGLRADLTADQGAYPVPPIASAVFVALVGCLLPNCYRIPAYEFRGRLVLTNRTPYVAYRGPWEMAVFAAERTMDLIARELGEEPADYRLRHLARVDGPDSRTVVGASLADMPRLGSTLRLGRGRARLGAFRAEQARARAEGRLLGLGITTLLEPAPGPWSLSEAVGSHIGPEPVRLVLSPAGRLTIRTAQIPHGQGQATTLSQIAASILGLTMAEIDVVSGDTAEVPYSLAGTGASRAAALAGGAVLRAARTLRERLLTAAGAEAGRPAHHLDLAAGEIVSRTDGTVLTDLPGLLRRHFGAADGRLDVTEVFDGAETGWAEATHCAWVEIDPDLGTVAVRRYLIVADSGRIINPAVADGQLRGGAVQGIATVLHERSGYAADGRQLSASLTDYLLPTTRTVPPIEIVHADTERPGDVPFRGLGEGGAVLAPAAVVAAVEDALAHLGVRLTERYLPPWRLVELLANHRTQPEHV